MSQAGYTHAILNGMELECPFNLPSPSSSTASRKPVPEAPSIKTHKQILHKIIFSSIDWLEQHYSTIPANNHPFNEEIRKIL